MRAAHTVEQVRAAERTLMARLPEGTLMQRAAAGLAASVIDLLGGAYGRKVLVLAGSGDNGGDALYAGAMLARRGASVEAVTVADGWHDEGYAALRAVGGRLVDLGDVRRPDVVIDGILGIGGRPGLPERARDAVEAVRGLPMVAVDVPSGVDVDTGRLDGPHVHADLTVTFGTHKVCHLVEPAAGACGAVHLVDIGLELPEARVEALAAGDVAALVPVPRPDDHKYTRGVVGVRTGSAGYPGAAVLGTAGAAAGLCGMVRYSGGAADAVRAAHPEVVVGEGRVQAWVVGPGGDDEAATALAAALADDVPVVVDADALKLLAVHRDLLADRASATVLTPHDRESARIADGPGTDRLAAARAAAADLGVTVLLKGNATVVAAPDGSAWVNPTGTPWLGTAGSGDVLAGVIAGLLARGADPIAATLWGIYVHAKIGESLSRSIGALGFISRELLDHIPRTLEAAGASPK